MIQIVPPEYTSQRCSRCGYIAKTNRLFQSLFLCHQCHFELNADLNASRNLLAFDIAIRERASVNSPNVAVAPPELSIKMIGDSFPSGSRGVDQLQAPELIQG